MAKKKEKFFGHCIRIPGQAVCGSYKNTICELLITLVEEPWSPEGGEIQMEFVDRNEKLQTLLHIDTATLLEAMKFFKSKI